MKIPATTAIASVPNAREPEDAEYGDRCREEDSDGNDSKGGRNGEP